MVVRWRGEPRTLPIGNEGEILLNALIFLDRLEALPGAKAPTLEGELDPDFAYVVLPRSPVTTPRE